MLNRCTGENLYPGFKSLPLRQLIQSSNNKISTPKHVDGSLSTISSGQAIFYCLILNGLPGRSRCRFILRRVLLGDRVFARLEESDQVIKLL